MLLLDVYDISRDHCDFGWDVVDGGFLFSEVCDAELCFQTIMICPFVYGDHLRYSSCVTIQMAQDEARKTVYVH